MLTTYSNDFHKYAPGNTYHLTRGYELILHDAGATLRGGPETIEIPGTATNYEDVIAAARARADTNLLVCIHSNVNSSTVVRLPSGTELPVSNCGLLLKTAKGLVCENVIGEYLIERIDFIRYLLKALLLQNPDAHFEKRALDIQAYLQDLVRAGKLGPDEFAHQVLEAQNNGIPIDHAFFTSAVRDLGEEIRHALFRSGYHFMKLTAMLCDLNRTESARDYPGAPRTGPCERQSVGSNYDAVSYEFSEVVTAAFSALDYLYRFFVFVLRRPVGNPERPKSLHFPDSNPSEALIKTGGAKSWDIPSVQLPLAIPNLTAKSFGNLRRARNDIAHNFGTDDIRPVVYIGINAPPKPNLQYVQYTIRDLAPNGTPSAHPWCEQFYRHQRDSQDVAYEYLESCWDCVSQTLEWLVARISGECRTNGISVADRPASGFYFL